MKNKYRVQDEEGIPKAINIKTFKYDYVRNQVLDLNVEILKVTVYSVIVPPLNSFSLGMLSLL